MRARSLIVMGRVVLATVPSALAQQLTDGGIYRWNNGSWMQMEGFGARISVGPDGAPWIVNAKNQIYRWTNGRFNKTPGTALDIGVGGDGRPWIIGTDNAVYRWNGNDWDRTEGSGVAISVEIGRASCRERVEGSVVQGG